MKTRSGCPHAPGFLNSDPSAGGAIEVKSKQSININQGSQETVDEETGEIMPGGNDTIDDAAAQIYGDGNQASGGSIIIPKITAAMIRCNPERAKIADKPMKMFLVTGIAGNEHLMPPADDAGKLEAMEAHNTDRMTFTALVAALEPWGAVRFDDEGEPDAVFKSDFLFLPVQHTGNVMRRRELGQIAIAYEFWAQPSDNLRGYSWFLYDLAKYDHGISPIDRMLKLGVQAGRHRELHKHTTGLLADLRAK